MVGMLHTHHQRETTMLSIKQKYDVQEDRKIAIQLPMKVEPGEHEIMVIVDQSAAQNSSLEIDPMTFSGTIDWPVDGMEFQKKNRNEWK